MAFGISPSSPTPPVTNDGFPDYNIQFQNDGVDLGEPADIDTVNFRKGVLATRGTGESTNVVSAEFDDSTAEYTPAGDGAAIRTVRDKLRESMSLADKGGDVTGAASAVTPLTNLFAESIGLLVIGTGTYDIPTDVTPAARDVHLVVDPTADFSGAGLLRLDSQIPFQGTPVFSHDLVRKDFGAEWAPYTNAFLRASYAQASADGVAVVAVFGGADARGADANCWGGNFVSYANHASGTAIGIELNYGVLVSGGLAYGLVIASAGNFQPQTAISVLANNAASQPINGVDFAWRATEGCVTGALIYSNGAVGATCEYFMRLTNVVASVAEIDIPSLAVEATQTGAANRVSIRGGAASSPPIISAKGSDTNINLEVRGKGTGRVQFVNNGATNFEAGSVNQPDYLRANAGTGGGQLTAQGTSSNVDVVLVGKGTGGVRLQDGAATTVIRVNTTGLGFFGATPAAKPTGVAVTAAGIHAALVTLGLIAA